MILLQLLRNQLDLYVLLLSAGRIHRRNRAQLVELRCDVILDIVVHVFLRRILDGEVHGRLSVHAHLEEGRIICAIRKLRLDGIHFLLQRIIGLIHIRTILILDDGHAVVFCGTGGDLLHIRQDGYTVLDRLRDQLIHILR